MKKARQAGTQALADLTADAVKRLLKAGPAALRAKSLYSPDELGTLADTLASITATGELLGRARIRRRMGQGKVFAEQETDFACFDEGVPLMGPFEALDYFTNLVPTLGVDPRRFGKQQERTAFTLAATTEKTILARVQQTIRQAIIDGDDVRATGKMVQKVLDAAGVGKTNPGYAEMVARTNMRDAYTTGAQRELAQVADYFPVYRYVGIADGRQGEDHAPHFDEYYPSSVPFTTVRGKRVYNCRCDFIPITLDEWRELKKSGAKIAAGYTDPDSGETAPAPDAVLDVPPLEDLPSAKPPPAAPKEVAGPAVVEPPPAEKTRPEPARGRVFESPAAADAWGLEHYEGFKGPPRKRKGVVIEEPGKGGLTMDENQLLRSYALTGYNEINGILRVEKPLKGVEKEWIDRIDGVIARNKTPEAVVAYRAASAPDIRAAYDAALSGKPGALLADQAYVSTGLQKKEPERIYDREKGDDKVIMEIAVPAGTPSMYLEHVGHAGEHELLLPRDSQFEVIGAKEVDGKRVLVVKWVGSAKVHTETYGETFEDHSEPDSPTHKRRKWLWRDGDFAIRD